MKTNCTRCGVLLTESNWRKSAITRKCLECISANRKEWYENNKERIKRKTKEFRDANMATIMYQRIKTKAKREGIPFDLEPEDIVIQGLCPVFGVPYVIGRPDRYNPSLDRINPLKGYIKGNVVVISKRANSIKNDASAEELRKVAAFVEECFMKGGAFASQR